MEGMEGMENVDPAAAAAALTGLGVFMLVMLAVGVVMTVANWKVFTKAGKPGWACLVPIYNIIVWLEIARKPVWWILLLVFVPFVNFVIAIILVIEVAKAYGKGTGFAMGLLFLGVIFLPILAWGDAKYQYGQQPMQTAVAA